MRLKVKVFPKSKINQLKKINSTDYHLHTTAPADKNKANQAVIKILSRQFNIPQSRISILAGAKKRYKIISIILNQDKTP